MSSNTFDILQSRLKLTQKRFEIGRVTAARNGTLEVSGLVHVAAMGDEIELLSTGGRAEVIGLAQDATIVLPDQNSDGLQIGAPVQLIGQPTIFPHESWVGRILDANGNALDDRPLHLGPQKMTLKKAPPQATRRKPLGARLNTRMAAFDTVLPIVRGQRIGLFAGSGVGKTMLLGNFAKNVDADIVVIALIGERGRELGEFVAKALGPEGMKRTIIVVATSDQSATERRRSLWTAITIAEFLRDRGNHVLLLADSITRFAEAHREIALAGGEKSSLQGFPPSTTTQIMAAAERAGPGATEQAGDITAVFSVLVAGSDMEGMVADTLRGVLDGHVVLDREIAERGRFPAIDILRSVSRSLPDAATDMENEIISIVRRRLGAYDRAELMIQSGLYVAGSDPDVDTAVQVWPALDEFLTQPSAAPEVSFQHLKRVLRITGSMLSAKK